MVLSYPFLTQLVYQTSVSHALTMMSTNGMLLIWKSPTNHPKSTKDLWG